MDITMLEDFFFFLSMFSNFPTKSKYAFFIPTKKKKKRERESYKIDL